jgi:AcrR family transcriptional regulator
LSVGESTRVYGGVSAEDRRAERRGRLVEAGLELLGREGWQGATVRAVCAEARLTERYFYESFDGRDELLLAVFDRVATEAAEAVLAAIEAAPHDARAKSRAAIEAFVELLTEDPRRGRAVLVESMGNAVLRPRREAAIRAFAALMSERGREFYGPDAVAETDAELTSLALAGGLAELLVAWLEGTLDVPRERLTDHCVELLVAAAAVSSE